MPGGPCRRRSAPSVAALLLLLLGGAGFAVPARAGEVDPEVAEALAQADSVPVLVVLEPSPRRAARARVDAVLERAAGPGLATRRRFARVGAVALRVDGRGLARLARDPEVRRVSLDRRVRLQLNQTRPLVNAHLVQAAGFDGDGVTVAVLDSGIDLDHPDLGGVVGEHCFCDDGMGGPFGCCPNGFDEQSSAEVTVPSAGQDVNGHGTQVAGILTADAITVPLGIAPAVSLVSVRVVDSLGQGFVSDVVAGLDWVRVNHPEAKVVNLSLGGGLYVGDCDGADADTMAVADAVADLEDAGVLVVAGSGNDGSSDSMILPACVSTVVSVGAVWDATLSSQTRHGCTDPAPVADQVTCFSNASLTTDLFAPGGRITTARLDMTTSAVSGTSYATPVVSACAANLVQAYPDATPAELRAALLTSPVSVLDTSSGRSYPRVDCLAALLELGGGTFVPGVPAAGPVASLALAALLAGLGGARLTRSRLRTRGR